jgi:F-type H+-transporting ATPase subunit b
LELNWSTFVLEIINFLVLVWILKRFLYRPVLAALKQRQDKIEQKLDEAARLKAEGTDLERQYQSRMEDWDREKQEARDSLHQEIQVERVKKLAQLEQELASERAKVAIIERRHQIEAQQQYQQNAHKQGARFAASLLSTAAGPEMELRLFDLLLQTFDQLDQTQLAKLQDNCRSAENNISVISAFPLSDVQRKQLQEKLSLLCKQPIQLECQEDPALIAGLRLIVGAWVLHLNIQDELKGFADLSHEQPKS